jgi:ketosteroid isomerase-like protein
MAAELVRIPLRLTSSSRRPVEVRLALAMPRLARKSVLAVVLLPVSWRIRRWAMRHGVLRQFEAANRNDLEAATVLFGEDSEVCAADPELEPPGLQGALRGGAGARKYMETWFADWDDPVLEPVELVDAGRRAAVLLRFHGRGRSSGVEVDEELAFVLEIGDGVRRQWLHRTWDSALRAVGAAPA